VSTRYAWDAALSGRVVGFVGRHLPAREGWVVQVLTVTAGHAGVG